MYIIIIMNTTEESCSICTEKYNKTNHFPVKCICDFTCCRSCIKQYIETKMEDIHCMSCRVKWTREFLYNHFEKKYLNTTYRIYRENMLYEKELGLLPMTQPYVENRIQCNKMAKELLEIETEYEKVRIHYLTKILEKQAIYNELRNGELTRERKKYIRKCPNNNCHGFLSSQLKCELCNSWVCSDCREIKGYTRDCEHTCNPDILESVKLMEQDTKPCPNCSSLIYKIVGCNQMFCTECHTPFDWKTLRIIERGAIHNPHYFEWQRRQNQGIMERNPNDVLCGRELDQHFVSTITHTFREECLRRLALGEEPKNTFYELCMTMRRGIVVPKNKEKFVNCMNMGYNDPLAVYIYMNRVITYIKKNDIPLIPRMTHIIDTFDEFNQKIDNIIHICRSIIHINHVEIPRFHVGNELDMNRDLRIDFMMNRITEDKLKIEIQKRDKKNQRNKELSNILRTFVSCSTDLLYRLNEYLVQYDDILNEMGELRLYTNHCMESTFKMYGSTMKHMINESFEYIY